MRGPVARVLAWPIERRIAVLSGVVAIVWAVVTLAPLGQTTIDPDATASVLFFQRIVAGQHLEAFVPTTPKPLLTLIYGLTWTIGHDWRWLTWETIGVFGVAIGAAAALVARVVGRIGERTDGPASGGRLPTWPVIAGAAFAVAGLLGSSDLLLEVSRANSLVWALALWLLAGLAVTARPARPWLAGLALFLAGLCRFETFAIDGAAVLALIASAWWRGRASREAVRGVAAGDLGGLRVPRASDIGGLVLAVAAFPVAMLHDWLLTANPFWFLSVPSSYTAIYNAGLQSIDPVRFAGTFVAHEGGLLPLAILAVIGVVALARAGEPIVAIGVASLAVGVVVLLFVLAARATYISNRYYEPLELAVLVGAAVGVGAAGLAVARAIDPRTLGEAAGPDRPPDPAPDAAPDLAPDLAPDAAPDAAPRLDSAAGSLDATPTSLSWSVPRGSGSTTATTAAAIVTAAIALALTWAPLPFDRSAMAGLTQVRESSQNLAQVVQILRSPLQSAANAEGSIGNTTNAPPVDFTTATALVPSRDVSQIAVEDDSRVTDVADLYAFLLHAKIGDVQTGQYLFHDGAVDRPVALFSPLELGPEEFATVQGVRLETRFETAPAPDGTRAWLLMAR